MKSAAPRLVPQVIWEIEEELERRREEAFEVGRDSERRARAIDAARKEAMDNPKDGPPFWT